MKLLLHWLLWDLRRFRWPLLGWVALLTTFSAWVWYLNAHILTVERTLFGYTEYFAAVLGIVELGILIALMGSDPAGGARAFWKTRPPTGYAVAGAKLITVIFFFLLLPLFSWWAVMKLCGLELHRPWKWGNNSWVEFIWWAGALGISALTLAGAAARGVGGVVGRLLTGIAVLILALLAAGPLLRASSLAGMFPSLAGRMTGGWTNMRVPSLWLICAVLFFILVRRTRTPRPLFGLLALAMPLLLCLAGDFIPRREPRRQEVENVPPLDRVLVDRLRISSPRMNSGYDYSNRYMAASSRDGFVAWPLRLVIDGLPENCMAYGRWTSMKLTAPDGRTVETAMAGGRYEGLDEPWGDGILTKSLITTGMVFRRADLAPFSLLSCRAEGVLELIVARKRERSFPLQIGASIRTRKECAIMLRNFSTTTHAGADVPVIEASLAGWDRGWMRLEKRDSRGSRTLLPVPGGDMGWSGGYFIQQERGDIRSGTSGTFQRIGYARLARDIQSGNLDGWTAVRAWYESEGRTEIAVSLEDLLIPRQEGHEREVESIITGMIIPESAEPAEAVKTVRYALVLAQERESTSAGLEAQLKRLLSGVQRKHFAALLDFSEPDPSEAPEAIRPYDALLYRRLAELVLPGDIPALRRRNLLWGKMKFFLAAQELISKSESGASAWESATGEDLASAWERGDGDSLEVLKQAAQRGLPWTIPAIQEVLELLPVIAGTWVVGDFLSPISDCPKDHRASIPWLKQNAARLTWDAAAKRWVLPANP